jgi:hypothetical protein
VRLEVLARHDDEPWFTEQAALAGANRLFVAVPLFLAGGTRAD